jgi:microcystin-dependent protein
VYNATSGAFTVTLKTLAGTGVVLPQGAYTSVYCDGTNVVVVDVSKTSTTGSAILPAGTTAQRDGTPAAGYTRVNTTLGQLEAYIGTAWKGMVALTSNTIDFINVAGTFVSNCTNANTAARTYTFQDRNGTIADNSDLALKANLISPALTGTPTAPTAAVNTNTTQLATTAYVVTAIGSLGVAAGSVISYAASTAPTGWLKANGAAISRTTYSVLFAAIGTTYGAGDGSTTFNIPELRGEFIRGLDDGRGVDTGRALGSYQADSFASHTHGLDIYTLGSMGLAGGGDSSVYRGSANTYAVGGSETRPRNVALLACIKY